MIFLTVLLFLIIKPVLLTNVLQERSCGSIDVLSYKDFDLLNNCTVVFGYVGIKFPPSDDPYYTREQMTNRTFPLREVTGFMLFYNVLDIDSPGKMFPNLTIIRGNRLFHNYALVIFDTEFNEIGFRNLLKISRGSVRIAGRNSKLCMPKIDWDSIIMSGHLVMIGSDLVKSDCDYHYTNCDSCERGLCWSHKACQRFDRPYSVHGTKSAKCHPLCLGKCINETSMGCFVCREKSEMGECVQQCSDYRFFNSDTKRCITGDECIKLGKKIYNRDCVQNCPSNYMVKMIENEITPVDNFCIPCLEKCPKICSNIPEIKTVAQLELMGIGCTIINGSLEINFIEDVQNLTEEMQVYLGDIEEIHGVLKIHRSTPISSLIFLNKLRLVSGLKNNKTAPFAIRIFENQNLQSIFDWRLRNGMKLEVKYGAIQIFSNNMLCESEIEAFKNVLIQNDSSDMADHVSNNGNLRTCRKGNIKTFWKVLSHDMVAIAWHDVLANKSKTKTVGYILQYKTLDKNEMKEYEDNSFFERDMCSSYGWDSKVLEQDKIFKPNKTDFPNATMSFIFTNLTQFTSYSFTLQRFYYNSSDFLINYETNSSFSGISEMKNFVTLMNRPSRAATFSAIIKTSNSITVKWSVVEKEKIAINRFLLYYFEKPIVYRHLDARDYCEHPIVFEENALVIKRSTDLVQGVRMSQNRCCEWCCKNQKKQIESLETDDDDFGKALIKFSETIPRPDPERHRADMKRSPNFQNYVSLSEEIQTYTVTNLKPYTSYGFHLYVCAARCGEYELMYERTAFDETYDQIKLNPIEQKYQGIEFRIKFEEPKLKNGAITSYIIEIEDVNLKVTKSECISRQKHISNNYEFVAADFPEGDYAFRIRAISLARQGPFTDWHQYKISKHPEESSKGLIMFSLSISLTLLAIIGITIYYKHKIKTILSRQNDTDILMNEMEMTDFEELSVHHNVSHFDQLSIITEHDDE